MFETPGSFLDEVIDRYQAQDLDAADPSRLGDDVASLSRAIDRLEAEKLRRARRWETSGHWATGGARSARAALAARTGTTSGAAGAELKLARGLESAPRTREAFAAGDLSRDKARIITAPVGPGATDALRRAFEACEDTIVDAAVGYHAANVGWFMRNWAAAADPDGHRDRYNDDYTRRRSHLSQSFEGHWHEDSLYDPEGGAIVKAAQELVTARMHRSDRKAKDQGHPDEERTPAQRRADAKVEIAATFLHGEGVDPSTVEPLETQPRPARRGPADVADRAEAIAGRPVDDEPDGEAREAEAPRRGTRPVIAIVADIERFAFDPTGVAYLLEGGLPLPQAALERNLCDCSVVRVLCAGQSQPLDIGRATRTPNAALARALMVRDGGCVFPDCDMPPRWCDAHHIVPWEAGGETTLDNLALLCRHHHRLVHDHHWSLHLDTRGRARFRPPQGAELAPRTSPHHIAQHGADVAERARKLDRDIERERKRRPKPDDEAA